MHVVEAGTPGIGIAVATAFLTPVVPPGIVQAVRAAVTGLAIATAYLLSINPVVAHSA